MQQAEGNHSSKVQYSPVKLQDNDRFMFVEVHNNQQRCCFQGTSLHHLDSLSSHMAARRWAEVKQDPYVPLHPCGAVLESCTCSEIFIQLFCPHWKALLIRRVNQNVSLTVSL